MQFTLLTALNMMGSGIIMLPAKVAQVGGIGLISWLIVCFAAAATAYTFAYLGMLSKCRLGGLGGIAENSFGRFGSFLTNYIYAFSVVIANVAIATSAVGYCLSIFGVYPSIGFVQGGTILLLWLATAANFAGPGTTGKLSAISIWGIFIPVLVLLVASPFIFDGEVFKLNWNPNGYPAMEAVTATVPMMFWAFLGIESACANADSVEEPEKSVPIAVLTATISVAVVYVTLTTVISGMIPEIELSQVSAPLFIVFVEIFGTAPSKIFAILLFLACAGSLISWQFTMYRVFTASAQLGYFPSIFKRVGSTGVPYVGLLCLCLVQTILVPFMPASNLFTQFDLLVDISVITNVMPYFLCLASTFMLVKQARNLSFVKKVFIHTTTYASLIFIVWYFSLMDAEVMKLATIVLFLGIAMYGMEKSTET